MQRYPRIFKKKKKKTIKNRPRFHESAKAPLGGAWDEVSPKTRCFMGDTLWTVFENAVAAQFWMAQKKGKNAKKRPICNQTSPSSNKDHDGRLPVEGSKRTSGGPPGDRPSILVKCWIDNYPRWSASGAGNGGFQRTQVREDERGV